MKSNVHDIIEYIIALVNEFARKFNLSEPGAFNYIKQHKGINFIENNYEIIHTLDFEEAIDSVALFCKNNGGNL